ncbi:hypothetical protein [Natrialba sp. PRR66]|uniref:hypothetical protein n=1 Tax=Natrialba sp. PRR66 TaxID=3098146 RepID=UPI002B1D368C|nr:hypothetical protein [Natrialba sp. PRR66]
MIVCDEAGSSSFPTLGQGHRVLGTASIDVDVAVVRFEGVGDGSDLFDALTHRQQPDRHTNGLEDD